MNEPDVSFGIAAGLMATDIANSSEHIEMRKELSPKQRDGLLAVLKARFDANKGRHPGLAWAKVQVRLEARPDKLWSLAEMERTGGEPDVVNQTLRQPASREWRGQFTPEFAA